MLVNTMEKRDTVKSVRCGSYIMKGEAMGEAKELRNRIRALEEKLDDVEREEELRKSLKEVKRTVEITAEELEISKEEALQFLMKMALPLVR